MCARKKVINEEFGILSVYLFLSSDGLPDKTINIQERDQNIAREFSEIQRHRSLISER